LANQPNGAGGVVWNIDSSAQGRAGLWRFCDAFEIPILTPGRRARLPCPVTAQEYRGVEIKHGAKNCCSSYGEATWPMVTV